VIFSDFKLKGKMQNLLQLQCLNLTDSDDKIIANYIWHDEHRKFTSKIRTLNKQPENVDGKIYLKLSKNLMNI
jgi:hypothetical protein